MPLKRLLRKFFPISLKRSFFQFFLGILFFIALVFIDKVFAVKNIRVLSSNKNLSLKGIQEFYGKNLLLIKEAEFKESIYQSNPSVKSVRLQREFPDRIKVYVTFYKPLVYLKVSEGYFILASDGHIIAKQKEKTKDLPELNYYQKLNSYSYIPSEKILYKDILTGLYFIEKTQDLGLKVFKVDIDGFNMIALNSENRKIFFTTERQKEIQYYQFEKIIKQFKIEGRDFTVLDLRFDKPVIKIK